MYEISRLRVGRPDVAVMGARSLDYELADPRPAALIESLRALGTRPRQRSRTSSTTASARELTTYGSRLTGPAGNRWGELIDDGHGMNR